MHEQPTVNRDREAPGIDSAGYVALQHAALKALLGMYEEPARKAEAAIDRKYEDARETADEAYQAVSRRLETRYHRVRGAGEQTYIGRTDKIAAKYEHSLERIEADKRDGRAKVLRESQEKGQAAKQKLDQEKWLAESVLEATRNKLRKEAIEIKESVEENLETLETIREQADAYVAVYRQVPPIESNPAANKKVLNGDLKTAFPKELAAATEYLEHLATLQTPSRFRGVRPYFYAIMTCGAFVALAGVVSMWHLPGLPSFLGLGPIGFLVGVIVAVIFGLLQWRAAKAHVAAVYVPLRKALANAELIERTRLERAPEEIRRQEEKAAAHCKEEIRKARDTYEPLMAKITRLRNDVLQKIEEQYTQRRQELEGLRRSALKDSEEWSADKLPRIDLKYDRYRTIAHARYTRRLDEAKRIYESERDELQARWREGLSLIESLIEATLTFGETAPHEWSEAALNRWQPPTEFAHVARFGEMRADLKKIAGNVHQYEKLRIDRSAEIAVPAMLTFPEHGSLLLQADRAGLGEAIRTLRAVMVQLLVSFPPGRVHFTIIDPVGLGQPFAGFMHLADYDEALIGGRIWTETAQIEQQLNDLTNHMENVIQKYLRNEFETIDEYNEQAGELAEPYRFLVVANYPANFSEDACRRLSSIISSGARCGVYTLIAQDARQPHPPGIEQEDIEGACVHLAHNGDRFVWKDEVFEQYPLACTAPPSEDTLTRLMHRIGAAAKESGRVEVSFDVIAPEDGELWSRSGTEDVRVPLGRTGATRLQSLSLGRGVAQHALIAGKTGSGKSTLLHVMVTNLSLWYSPDEVEFYLVDFKKGVEFKTYATHDLPHARAIAIESDREFGLSVLQRLDAEIDRRGDMYRKLGVQDLPAFRAAAPNERMPRTLLIIDEFQAFFSEDDKIAHDAAMLLDRLVRQGRAFGIHVILGSQTLGGASGLARSTLGQMAVRIALQCSEVDSQLILSDENTAARLLTRPGEAIYNNAGGLVDGNSPFQTAWLPDSTRDVLLRRVTQRAAGLPPRDEPLIVFEGNAAGDMRKNQPLASLLAANDWPLAPSAGKAWLGEAIAIKEPTAAVFARQSGSSLLIVGQRDEAALSVLTMALIGLAAQYAPRSARFMVFDGTTADSPLAGLFKKAAAALPHDVKLVEYRDAGDAVVDLATEVRRRRDEDDAEAPSVFVFVYGLHRYRMLRSRDDDFSFSTEEKTAADPGKDFSEVLKEGPAVGVHVLTWADTLTSVERTLDRQAAREFDQRVLFQMSAADSSNLIDAPDANRLGFHRALLHSEERGVFERFRPYAEVDDAWIEHVRTSFANRA